MSDWKTIERPFREALIDAFNRERLAIVLQYHCDRRLNNITSKSEGFEKNVDDVIEDAVRNGWLEKLAQGALAENELHIGLKATVPHILAGVAAEGKAFYQSATDVPHVEETEQVSDLNKRKSSLKFIAAGVVLIIILGLLLLYASQEVNLPVFQNNVFTYVVRVKDKNTDQNIPYANVIVEVPGQLPVDGITDVNGIVSIPISATYAEKPGRILVEKQGYDPYRQEINLQRDSLPVTVQLKSTDSIAPATPEPTFSPTTTPAPSQTPTATFNPTATHTPTATPTEMPSPTATETPSPMPTETSTPLSITSPSKSTDGESPTLAGALTLISPHNGASYKNPIEFSWQGAAGQQYQVVLWHSESGHAITSDLLRTPSWTLPGGFPDDRSGEWYWYVEVPDSDMRSETWSFWFDPFAGRGGQPATPTPAK